MIAFFVRRRRAKWHSLAQTTPIVASIGYAYGFVFAGANLFMCVRERERV